MLADFAPKFANLIAGYSIEVREGDIVYINSSANAEPLLLALYEEILKRGGHPLMHLALPGTGEAFFEHASDAQLDFVDPRFGVMVEQADVYMVLQAPSNTKAMSGVDPQKFTRTQRAIQPHFARMLERMGAGDLRYHLTQWPTDAAAQQAEMGLRTYARFVYEACALTEDDPVAYWQNFRAEQLRLAEWLRDKKHAEVKGPGIDLSFDFAGRVWISAHGDKNMPDGEIFTGPIEDSVNGHVEFSYPSVYMGREVDGIALAFQDGLVTAASAAKNEEFLLAQLDADEGARRLGEFAIGTNKFVQQYTGNILFDEKIGGTIHMALGSSIPETKGVNQSAVHWDIVHGMQDGGEIWIDGTLFYQNGEFKV